jgi:hypothetical protein
MEHDIVFDAFGRDGDDMEVIDTKVCGTSPRLGCSERSWNSFCDAEEGRPEGREIIVREDTLVFGAAAKK